jgi:NAD(P)-dependent dehydrogenase (short-subunit alcohol dehydrogenase family)
MTPKEILMNDSTPSRREVLQAAALLGISAVAARAAANTKDAVAPGADRANSNGTFAGKVVWITGGARGIGKATALAFARQGAKVAICDILEGEGQAVAQQITAMGGTSLFVTADVSDENAVKSFVEATAKQWGRIDIAFNNAGIDRPNAPIHQTDTKQFNELIAVNLNGVFFSLKHVIAQMLQQQPQGGHIVNIASVGGHRGYGGIIGYSASKAAVLSMTRTAASEVSDKNIRVNSISPGPIVTAMLERAQKDWGLPGLEAFAAGAAVKRNGTPEEVARAVMWLCSPEASYIAGADLLIDGGYLLK